MDALADSGNQACLSAASWFFVWGAAIRSRAEPIGKKESDNRHFASGGRAFYGQC
jgi:hypothetical protein